MTLDLSTGKSRNMHSTHIGSIIGSIPSSRFSIIQGGFSKRSSLMHMHKLSRVAFITSVPTKVTSERTFTKALPMLQQMELNCRILAPRQYFLHHSPVDHIRCNNCTTMQWLSFEAILNPIYLLQ